MSLPLPRPICKGSHLAIVAPSGPFDEEAFRAGVAWLEQRYEITHHPAIGSRAGYLAGDDTHRLSQLQNAIRDPDIDGILCARGGYGATRLLPELSLEEITRANKLIVGFSDITALHTLWARAGVRSIHAPMVAALSRASDPIRQEWIRALENPDSEKSWALSPLHDDSHHSPITGRLTGGNLAVLAALNGTPYTPQLEGRILFIEDVGERPYRIDRILTTLKQSGWFDQLSGLILGAFTEGDPGPDGVSIDDVFRDHFSEATFPILSGFSAGHIEENLPLHLGAEATIEGDTLTVSTIRRLLKN